MPDQRHRPKVSLALRRQNERAAARALLASPVPADQHALEIATDRLWRHARRARPTAPGARYVVFIPDLDTADDADERTRFEETVTV